MATCEFEEREFEAPLYHQLVTKTNHVWSPGQVLEQKLGIDYALMCEDPKLWGLHGLSSPLGVSLHQLAYHLPHIKRSLPNFSLNLFIQAKRPQPRVRATKKLKDHGLKSPYWRFTTTPHQQSRLDNLATVLGADALVCYAAPVFHRLTQLNAHTISGSVIANSTFPKASMLSSPHKAWNYSVPGVVGLANTEPTFYEEPSLEQQIQTLLQERSRRLEEDDAFALNSLASLVRESVSLDTQEADSRSAIFSMRAERIDFAFAPFPSNARSASITRDYLHVANYVGTFNMMWLTIGRDSA